MSPRIIDQYEERTAKLKADVPTLEGIMSKKWGKEDELKQLKSDLAALDRKIQAEIAPKHEEADGVENKKPNPTLLILPQQTLRSQWWPSHYILIIVIDLVNEPSFNRLKLHTI